MERLKLSSSPHVLISEKRIGVVIPAYNVQNQIERTIRSIPPFVERIVVVNDRSTDSTAQRLAQISDPRLIVVHHEKNQGVGGAMLTGYAKASELGMDVLVKMDGDDQMDPKYLPALVKPLLEGHAHYSKGNRFFDYRLLDTMPPIRRFGNALLSFLTKLVSGYWNIFDVTNGYTAMLAGTFNKIDTRKIAKSYFFETSMLIELNIVMSRVVDIDIPARYQDEKSNIKTHRILTKFPILLMRGFARRFYQRYLLRDFSALSVCVLTGLPMFLFGVLYAIYLWVFPPYPLEATPAGTVMLAALPIILGFQLLLAALILDIVFTPAKPPAEENFISNV